MWNVAYACGTPVRKQLMWSVAKGFQASIFQPFCEPKYLGGNSIVWGLMRGARDVIDETKKFDCDFLQVDNGYFGREKFFRISKNSLQFNGVLPGGLRDAYRARIRAVLHDTRVLNSEKSNEKTRGDKILITLSSENLYRFHGTTAAEWLDATQRQIRAFTDRPIFVRPKGSVTNIKDDLARASCLVTHSSASALDALAVGVPVICTDSCAASSYSEKFESIENLASPENVADLFESLALLQFTEDEIASGLARDLLEVTDQAMRDGINLSDKFRYSLGSDSYAQEQKRLHLSPTYGSTSRLYADEISDLIREFRIRSLLDFGAGKAWLAQELRERGVDDLEYYPVDIAYPEYGPPSPKEAVVCIDVLEHVEPEFLDSVLATLARCCLKFCFVTVHTGPAKKTLSDGRNAHLIQEPLDWWAVKFKEHRFAMVRQRMVENGFCCLLTLVGEGGSPGLP